MIYSLNIFYLFQQLVSSFKEKSLEHQHGILLAIGYAFGLNILKNKAKKKDKEWRLFRFELNFFIFVYNLLNHIHIGQVFIDLS